jgi:ABC-2 type transport system permease protein
MTLIRELRAAARLDLAEILRSRWMLFCVGVYALTGVFFVLVGLRESSVIGFTGMGRVLFSLCHLLVLLLPLLALTATTQVVNRSREDGTLEYLFSLPLRRTSYFAAVSLSRYLMLVAPLVVTVLALAIFGSLFLRQEIPWAFIGRTLAVSSTLLLAFAGIGLLISTVVRNQARAMLCALLAWAMGVVLLDFGLIGLMLQWRLNAQTVLLLATLNPVQTSRLALVTGADAELSVLGPVGFYLTQHFGSAAMLAVGLLWPSIIGLGCWLWAARSFRRGDLV